MAQSLLEEYRQEVAAPAEAATAAAPTAKATGGGQSLLEEYRQEIERGTAERRRIEGAPAAAAEATRQQAEPEQTPTAETPAAGPPSPTFGQSMGQRWTELMQGSQRTAAEIRQGFGQVTDIAGRATGLLSGLLGGPPEPTGPRISGMAPSEITGENYMRRAGVVPAPTAQSGELGTLKRPDGGVSTELSVTVTDPRLNGGRPTNVPLLVKGQTGVDTLLRNEPATRSQEEIAIKRAAERVRAGESLPAFDTIEDAVREARLRSQAQAEGRPYVPGRKEPGIYAAGPRQEGYLEQALNLLGLRDPAAVEERKASRERAQAQMAYVGAKREPGPDILGQAAGGFVEGATGGLAGAIQRAYGFETPEPTTVPQAITRGLGHLGGFIAGAPMAAGRAAGRLAFEGFLAPAVTDSMTAILARHVAQEAVTLGVASGAGATGKAVEQNNIKAVAKEYGQAAGHGALLGAVFGTLGASGLIPQGAPENLKELTSLAARYGLGLAALDAATGQQPLDDRAVAQKAFDYGLNVLFLFRGRNTREVLDKIYAEAQRRGVAPDDVVREAVDAQKAQHIADARAFNPEMFDKAFQRYAQKNKDLSRQDVEYLVARLLIGNPGEPIPGSAPSEPITKAPAEPPPPPPAERGVASVTFVGYDQTKSPAEPMFSVSSRLDLPSGISVHPGMLIPGSVLRDGGYGLPDYPKAPQGGGHAPGLEPESVHDEARVKQGEELAKREQEANKAADKVVADAEKVAQDAIEEAGQADITPAPWIPPTPTTFGPQGALIPPTDDEGTQLAQRLQIQANPEAIPAEEGLDEYIGQIEDSIARADQYLHELPEGASARGSIAKSRDLLDLMHRVALRDPDGLLDAADELRGAWQLIQEHGQAKEIATWEREAASALDRLTELHVDAREPTRTLIGEYVHALSAAMAKQAPAAPEKPASKPRQAPETEKPAPAPKAAPEPATPPTPGKFGGQTDAEKAKQEIRDKLKGKAAPAPAPAPEGAGKNVPRGTPTAGGGPAPAPAPAPRTPRAPTAPRPPAPAPAPPGKFGGQDEAQRLRDEIRNKLRAGKGTAGLMAAEGAPQVDVEVLGSIFQLGGIVHEGGATAYPAWVAEMDREIADLGVDPALVAPYHQAIFDLIEVAATGPLSPADLRGLLVYGGTLLEQTPARADWERTMVEDLDESVQPYLDPLYRIAKTVIEGPTYAVPTRPGDEGAPEATPPPGVPAAEEERPAAPAPAGQGEPPGRPDAGGAGAGDVARGGEGAGGSGSVPAGGGPEPGPAATGAEPRVPQGEHTTPATDIGFTDELIALNRGPARRFTDNLAAIKLLKQIEAAARSATPEEQKILARFVGWGGLRPLLMRADNKAEILQHITPEEYRGAEKSSLTAFYTEPRVARAVWRLAERLGFTGGLVLDPSTGTGIFPGSQPAPGLSRRVMVERDPLSARIARQLFPMSQVHQLAFEDFIAPDNFYDLATSNVPFLELAVRDKSHDRRYQRAGVNATVHDFFFAKSLDKVRPGGLVLFITGIGTMDKAGTRARQWLAERAELVGAIRLPNETFNRWGTGSPSDLIVLKKREAPITAQEAKTLPWVSQTTTVEIPGDRMLDKAGPATVNAYWAAHPEHVVGAWRRDKLHPRRISTETGTPRDAWEGLEKAVETFPEGVMTARTTAATEESPKNYELMLPPPGAFPKPGGFAVVNGRVGRNLDEKINGVPALTPIDLPPREVDRMVDIIALRDQINEVLRQNRNGTDEELAEAQHELNRQYEAFVAKWTTPEIPATPATKKKPGKPAVPAVPGYVSSREVNKLYGRDPDFPRLRGLERIDRVTRVVTKAPIFSQRIAPDPKPLTAEATSPRDAMARALALTGRLDWPFMARIYPTLAADIDEITERPVLGGAARPVGIAGEGEPATLYAREQALFGESLERVPTTTEGIQRRLEREEAIFLNPETGVFEAADWYLSGNVRAKLEAARAARDQAEENSPEAASYARAAAALERVLPVDRTPEQIDVLLGAPWIDQEEVGLFAGELFGVPKGQKLDTTFVGATGRWIVRFNGSTIIRTDEARQWGTPHVSPIRLLERTLNKKIQPMISYKVNGEWVKDPDETELARLLQEAIKQRFKLWLWENEERAQKYLTRYNEQFNSHVEFDPDGSHLTFPGMSEVWRDMMRRAQKDATWRIIVAGNTLLTHAVGHGKSPILVAAAIELKRLGLAHKVMMVVPNSTVPQMGRLILDMYPSVNLIQINPGDMSAANREEFLGTVAYGNWDIVLVPQSSFNLFNMSPQAEISYIDDRLDELRAALGVAINVEGVDPKTDPSVREILKSIERLEDKLAKTMDRIRARGSKGLDFEDLGVDALITDEAHDYKNLRFPTQMAGIAGVPSGDSPQRALQLHMKTLYLAKMNGERNIIFATGTPLANSLTEAYVMMSYLMPERLKQMGLGTFDAWASAFARVTTEPEFSLQGIYAPKARLREFVNVPGMIQLFRQVATRQLSPEEAGIVRPRLRGGLEVPEDLTAPEGDPFFWTQEYANGVRVVRAIMSPEQIQAMLNLQHRAEHLPPRPGPGDDNMLLISTDARKLALDIRLVDPEAPANPNGKIPTAAGILTDVYRRTTEANPREGTVERGTSLVFIDLGTPKAQDPPKDTGPNAWELTLAEWAILRKVPVDSISAEAFYTEILAAVETGQTIPERVIASLPPPLDQAISDAIQSRLDQGEQEAGPAPEIETIDEIRTRNQIYGILRADLVSRGIPIEHIAFIHDAKTSEQRQQIFDRVNAGDIRILVGSRGKMGVGVNVQERVAAIVHVDTPWRPDQVEQADGRGWRPGNQNKVLEIYRIVSVPPGAGNLASPDAAMWQKLETKAKQQSQLMRGKIISVNSIEDIGGSLIFQAQELIGLASNNPLAIEMANLENRLASLELLHAHEQSERRNIRAEIAHIDAAMRGAEIEQREIDTLNADADLWATNKEQPLVVAIGDKENAGQKAIDQALEAYTNKPPEKYQRLQIGQQTEPIEFGTFRGFDLLAQFQKVGLGPGDYRAFLFVRGPSGIVRPTHSFTLLGINGTLAEMRTRAITLKARMDQYVARRADLEARLNLPYTHEAEIAKGRARLQDIKNQLGMRGTPQTGGGSDDTDDDDDGGGTSDLSVDEGVISTADQAYTQALSTGDRRAMAAVTDERVRDFLEARSAPGAPVAAPPSTLPPTITSPITGELIMRPDVMIQEMARVVRRLQGGGLILSGSGFRGKDGLHGYYVYAAPPRVLGGVGRHGVGNIYLRRATDTDTAAHEIGHMIQDVFWTMAELTAYKPEIDAARSARLGQDVSPSGDPIEEGWSEFMALYLTDPVKAVQVAPTLMAEFEKRLDKPPGLQGTRYARQAGDLRRVFMEFRRQYQLRSTASYEQRLKAVIAETRKPGLAGELGARFRASMDALKASAQAGGAQLKRSEWIANVMMPAFQDTWDVLGRRMGSAWGQAMTSTFMANRPIRVMERTLDPKGKLAFDDSPLVAVRTMSPKATEAARIFLEQGILDPRTAEVSGPSYNDILRTIDPDGSLGEQGREAFGRYLIARHILELGAAGRQRILEAKLLERRLEAAIQAGQVRPQDAHGTRAKIKAETDKGQGQVDQSENLRGMTWSHTQPKPQYGFLPPSRTVPRRGMATPTDEVMDFVNDVHQALPRFDDAHKLWRRWNDGVLDYVEQVAGLPAEDMQRIRDTYDTVTWVPLQRVFAEEKRESVPEGSGQGGKQRPTFYRRGSGRTQRPLLNPMVAAPQNMYYAITAAERNQALRTLYELQNEYKRLGTAPLAGQFIETVAAPQMPVTPGPSWIRAQVKRALAKDGAIQEELDYIDRLDFSGAESLWVRSPRPGDVWKVPTRAGWAYMRFNDKMVERVFTSLDAETLRSMVGATIQMSNMLMRMYRWGTIHNPGFAVAAIMKDQATSLYRHGVVAPWLRGIIPFLAEQPALATSAVSGLMGALGGGPMVGTISAAVGGSLPFISRAAMTHPVMAQAAEAIRAAKIGGGNVLGERISFSDEGVARWMREQGIKEHPETILQHPLTALRLFLRQMNGIANISDMPTRIGTAMAMATEPEPGKPSPTQSANERARLAIIERDSAMDWEQFGSKPSLRIVAMLAPFLGANVTAFYQDLTRPVGQSRWQIAWRLGMYLAAMALGSALAFWWEREDPRFREMARGLRSLYLPLIFEPKTHGELLAMTPEQRASNNSRTMVMPLNPFGGAMVSLVRELLEQYVDRPAHLAERTAAGAVFRAGRSMTPAGGDPWMMAPLPIRAAAEVSAGRVFFSDRPLTPVTLRGLAPEYQISERTTEAAKFLGLKSRDLSRATGKMVPQLSPIEIDHLIYSFGGLMTSMSARSIERFALEQLADEKFPTTPATRDVREAVPGWNRFIAAYPGLRHQSVQDYYDRRREAEGYRDTWNAAIKSGDRARIQQLKGDPVARYFIELSQTEAFMEVSSQLAELRGEGMLLRKDKEISADRLRDRTDNLLMRQVDLAYRAVVVAEGLRRAKLEGK